MTNGNLNGKVHMPTWVMLGTYVCCWTFGAALLITSIIDIEDIHNRGLILAIGVYLILWPMIQTSPAEMLRKVFPS